MKDTKGAVSFRAVNKKELDVKKDMSGEEAMILSYIQAAANEGIWTKHLKAKTELHQTVVDRCLKSLTQKQLIKAVKSVKASIIRLFPTRKIYMLAHLEPSVEMTGGPWYTDNELDTELIKLLCSACLRFIRDRSAPKQKGGDSSSSNLLYPISAAPAYPTAQQILTFLSKSRITETQLSVEHVEMLLNVLVLDGEVERVPAFGAAMWDTSEDLGAGASDDEDRARRRKRKSRDDDESPKRKRKRSKPTCRLDLDIVSRAAIESDPALPSAEGSRTRQGSVGSMGSVSEDPTTPPYETSSRLFKATFDEVKTELAAGRWRSLDEMSIRTGGQATGVVAASGHQVQGGRPWSQKSRLHGPSLTRTCVSCATSRCSPPSSVRRGTACRPLCKPWRSE
ncbi:RNA polymerase Rpc34 subunit-domain-containing protein [Cubamyces lactineus]|nr:RNA polymerase Rpc34 subunit-domain-containing protein [Cubamyces lactineus]